MQLLTWTGGQKLVVRYCSLLQADGSHTASVTSCPTSCPDLFAPWLTPLYPEESGNCRNCEGTAETPMQRPGVVTSCALELERNLRGRVVKMSHFSDKDTEIQRSSELPRVTWKARGK